MHLEFYIVLHLGMSVIKWRGKAVLQYFKSPLNWQLSGLQPTNSLIPLYLSTGCSHFSLSLDPPDLVWKTFACLLIVLRKEKKNQITTDKANHSHLHITWEESLIPICPYQCSLSQVLLLPHILQQYFLLGTTLMNNIIVLENLLGRSHTKDWHAVWIQKVQLLVHLWNGYSTEGINTLFSIHCSLQGHT